MKIQKVHIQFCVRNFSKRKFIICQRRIKNIELNLLKLKSISTVYTYSIPSSQAQKRNRGIAVLILQPRRCMRMDVKCHAAAAYPTKETRCQLYRRLSGRVINISLPPGFDPARRHHPGQRSATVVSNSRLLDSGL
jgi:hypothetical protein